MSRLSTHEVQHANWRVLAGTPQVFDSVCELVQSALDGYHVCLFSYGQTGAGKTFTMSGGPTPEQQGIMPRAVQQVRT
jgi:hypothetical protein